MEYGSLRIEKTANSDRERDMTYLTRVFVFTLHLACLLTRLLEHHTSTPERSKITHQAIYNLVKLKIRARSNRTALHLACCRYVRTSISPNVRIYSNFPGTPPS